MNKTKPVKMQKTLLATMLFSIFAGTTHAQSENEDQQNASPNEKPEVIVVTSQKRIQRIIDVPLAVTNVSDEEIAQRGIKQLVDIGDAAPNLIISQDTDFRSKVTIRGVGANSRNIGFDSRVGIYIDGVYLGQSPALNQGMVDLERIEVLRGPQGTLFGQNSIAGAVNLISQKPTDTFEGAVTATIGNFDVSEYHLKLNIPITDNTAMKVFANKADGGGFIDNIYTGQTQGTRDDSSFRMNIVSNVTDNLVLDFSADYTDKKGVQIAGNSLTDVLGREPELSPFAPIYAQHPQFSETIREKYTTYQPWDPEFVSSIYGASLTVEYTTDSDFTLKSITALRDTDFQAKVFPADTTPIELLFTDYRDTYEQTTQEFQLISPDVGNFKYVAGIYLYQLDAETRRDAIGGDGIGLFGDPRLIPGRTAAINEGTLETTSYAVYGNASYDLNDRLQLGLGLRFSSETREVDWYIDGSNSGFFNLAVAELDEKIEDDQFTPMINLNYSLNENTQVYASYSTGFKSGGYNLDYVNPNVVEAGLEFDSETVKNFEIGYKSQPTRDLSIYAALFRADYSDYQVNQYIDLGDGRTAITIQNAASVISQGLELEVDYQITDDLSLSGNLGLLDATFDSFPGGGTNGADASGNALPNAPELTAGISLQYYQEVEALNSSIYYRVDFNHTAEQYYQVSNDENYVIPGSNREVDFDKADSFNVINARISLITNDEDWNVSLWGRNLTDSDHLIASYREFFGGINALYARPRSYGIEVQYNF